MEFEWDEDKADSNGTKHGVSFDEADSVLADPLSLTWYDEEYSVEEDRYLTIGVSDNFQTLIVSHTYCGGLVRIISVRPATRQEIRDCEDGSSSK